MLGKLIQGANDLQTVNPKLANEWDYKKNENLTPNDITSGSNKNVWWICEKGHSYSAKIKSRNKGNACPYCSGHRVLTGFNDLATTNPLLLQEWDYEKNGDLAPTDVMVKSGKKVWWICDKGHSYSTRISHKTDGHGCPYCANQKVLSGYNDLATTNFEITKEWDYKKKQLSKTN